MGIFLVVNMRIGPNFEKMKILPGKTTSLDGLSQLKTKNPIIRKIFIILSLYVLYYIFIITIIIHYYTV
jgi:hypothetical protein